MFEIGDIVYHRSDEMNKPLLITGIVQRPRDVTTYMVTTEEHERECYEFELTENKTIH